jgi:hypothetical protein
MSGYSPAPDHPASGDDQHQAAPSEPAPSTASENAVIAAELLRVEDALYILECLARGHTDNAIARSLGISSRTINRRMTRMMDAVGARTRFQLGIRITPELRDAIRSPADNEIGAEIAVVPGESAGARLRTFDRLRRQLDRRGQPIQGVVWLWLETDERGSGLDG